MPYYTPLRYPGGKRRLAPAVMRLIDQNALKNVEYAEPYAGGSAIALALLFSEYAAAVHINDLSRPVYAFWHTAVNETADLCRRLELVKVTMSEWRRQRATYDNRDNADLTDLGFAALFLNRTNRSGIIGGGVIGGKNQAGAWSMDARFSKAELVRRIKRIGRYRNRINLYQLDALEFTNRVIPTLGSNVFAFYDPPYIENGEDLYLNNYDVNGHRVLADKIITLDQPWIVTYDHAAIMTGLYQTQRRMIYGLSYSAQNRHQGQEVMFFADRLTLPQGWSSHGSGRVTLSRSDSRYPLYGKVENVKTQDKILEGPDAFERFRKAVQTIIRVPKTSIATHRPSKRAKKEPSGRRRS